MWWINWSGLTCWRVQVYLRTQGEKTTVTLLSISFTVLSSRKSFWRRKYRNIAWKFMYTMKRVGSKMGRTCGCLVCCTWARGLRCHVYGTPNLFFLTLWLLRMRSVYCCKQLQVFQYARPAFLSWECSGQSVSSKSDHLWPRSGNKTTFKCTKIFLSCSDIGFKQMMATVFFIEYNIFNIMQIRIWEKTKINFRAVPILTPLPCLVPRSILHHWIVYFDLVLRTVAYITFQKYQRTSSSSRSTQ